MSELIVLGDDDHDTGTRAYERVLERHGGQGPCRGRRLAPVLVATVLAVSACGGTGETGAGAGAADLAGRSFVSTGVTGHELVAGSEVRLIFSEDRVSVNAGCNTLTGAATWDDGVLAVDEHVATTQMACDDALMQQDDWLLAFLKSGPRLTVEGSTLTLGDESESLVLDEL